MQLSISLEPFSAALHAPGRAMTHAENASAADVWLSISTSVDSISEAREIRFIIA
jgi:hypothetical protein